METKHFEYPEKKKAETINLNNHAIYEVSSFNYDKLISSCILNDFCNKHISQVLVRLADIYDLSSIKRLNLANNYIKLNGAIEILEFVLTKLPNLEVLDISYNSIANSSHPDFDKFSYKITEVLKGANFKFLLLRGNDVFSDRSKTIHNPNAALIEKLPSVE